MLSTPAFTEFSKKYVMFLHLTTKIKTDKHQGLLAAKGGRGFPYLAYLSADGALLGKPAGRTIAAFEQGAQKASVIQKQLIALREKAAAGDVAAKKELFLLGMKLGAYDSPEALKKAQEGLELSDAQKAMVAGRLVDFEVQAVMKKAQAMERQAGRAHMTTKFYEMAKQGATPTGKQEILYLFFFGLQGAEAAKDVKTFERGVTILKKHYGNHRRFSRMVQGMERKLAAMKAGAGGAAK